MFFSISQFSANLCVLLLLFYVYSPIKNVRSQVDFARSTHSAFQMDLFMFNVWQCDLCDDDHSYFIAFDLGFFLTQQQLKWIKNSSNN